MCSEVKICITQVFKYNHIPIKLHSSDALSNYFFLKKKKCKKQYLNMFRTCAKKQTKSNYILAIQNIRRESKSSTHSVLKKISRKNVFENLSKLTPVSYKLKYSEKTKQFVKNLKYYFGMSKAS